MTLQEPNVLAGLLELQRCTLPCTPPLPEQQQIGFLQNNDSELIFRKLLVLPLKCYGYNCHYYLLRIANACKQFTQQAGITDKKNTNVTQS